nr:MAG TPA: hypothetical protein [Bacteriophage sp.]
MFIDLPPQVSGLSQLDHWQGKRNFQSRTGKLVSIDICPIADRFHITRIPGLARYFTCYA